MSELLHFAMQAFFLMLFTLGSLAMVYMVAIGIVTAYHEIREAIARRDF